jgi:hypothetical protein
MEGVKRGVTLVAARVARNRGSSITSLGYRDTPVKDDFKKAENERDKVRILILD